MVLEMSADRERHGLSLIEVRRSSQQDGWVAVGRRLGVPRMRSLSRTRPGSKGAQQADTTCYTGSVPVVSVQGSPRNSGAEIWEPWPDLSTYERFEYGVSLVITA